MILLDIIYARILLARSRRSTTKGRRKATRATTHAGRLLKRIRWHMRQADKLTTKAEGLDIMRVSMRVKPAAADFAAEITVAGGVTPERLIEIAGVLCDG